MQRNSFIKNVKKIDPEDITLLKPLGKGYWKNRNVAVKKFKKNRKEKDYFNNEVKQLSRVHHRYIIELFGVSEKFGRRLIILELIQGGSLHEFLHGDDMKSYDKKQGLCWAQQCAEGVAYLHSMQPKPLLHRDLKPANLLLTHNYTTIKICDFGTVAELKTTMSNNRGTLAYTAPEVYEGTRYDEKCDVFSWGILTWEILSREVPFKDYMNAVISDKIKQGERPILRDNWPSDEKNLIKKAWDKDSSKRPTMESIAKKLLEKGYIPLKETKTSDPLLEKEKSEKDPESQEDNKDIERACCVGCGFFALVAALLTTIFRSAQR